MVKRAIVAERGAVMGSGRLGIFQMAAETAAGDLDQTWQAWLHGGCGERRPGDWHRRTRSVLKRAVRGCNAGALGLVLGTTKGDLEREVVWLRGGGGDMPTIGQEAERLAQECGLGGMTWAVSTACSSGIVALIEAAMTVKHGEANAIIAMGADDVEAGEGFVTQGFRSLKALSAKGCRPFDATRDGLTLGSAAAACVVSEFNDAAACEILGWGVSNDAVHMTAPDREAGGLVRAMRQALTMASLKPSDVDVLFAHGTGTAYNDAMEAVAIDHVFSREGAKPAVTAVKGLIGHTLGACGLVEALLAVKMIESGQVPGIVGLANADRADPDLVRSVRQMNVRHVMKVASGFGGMNAAVILGSSTLRAS